MKQILITFANIFLVVCNSTNNFLKETQSADNLTIMYNIQSETQSSKSAYVSRPSKRSHHDNEIGAIDLQKLKNN